MKKKVIVTTSWDDGHKLDLKVARILKRCGLKGTFYISPNNMQWKKKDLLTERQIVKLSKDFEIGAHTLTHPELDTVSVDVAREEIFGSKKYLEKLIGKYVVSFCYPRGKYNKKVQEIVRKLGFTSARTLKTYQFNFSTDLFASGSTIHVYKHYSDIIKIAKFSNYEPKRFLRHMDWELLAKEMFDYVSKHGGLYHLLGHSWEVDKNNDWEKLERVLSYIGNNTEATYVQNKDLVKFYKQ